MEREQNVKSNMQRREFIIKTGVATGLSLLPTTILFGNRSFIKSNPNSALKGVRLGAITYSFRDMPSTADDLLGYLVELNLDTVELMGGPAEAFAGAPQGPGWKPGELTEEEKAERKAHREELKKWRLSTSMKPFKILLKNYSDEGVNIEIIKLPMDRMSPEEINYSFKVANAVGARGITLERSDDAVELLSSYADKHKVKIGYHNHAKVDFNSWDTAMNKSSYNAINLDVGHYVAGTNQSPVPLIRKYHDRILNLHLKDRKMNNGENMPWGQGDTPLKEILQLIRDENYQFMATIELEYPIPEGSNSVTEVRKCMDFCRNAVES